MDLIKRLLPTSVQGNRQTTLKQASNQFHKDCWLVSFNQFELIQGN